MSFPAQNEAQNKFHTEIINRFDRPLDSVGNGTGSVTINGSYTPGAPGVFAFIVPPGLNAYVEQVDFYIEGSGSIRADRYGMITALPNGMILRIRDESSNPVGQIPDINLSKTGSFAQLGMESDRLDTGGTGSYMRMSWLPASAGGLSMFRPGWMLQFVGQDDLTALSDHTCTAKGYFLAVLP